MTNQAKNFTIPETFEICEGIVTENKIRVGGAIYIEEEYGKTFEEFYNDDLQSGRVKPIMDLLTAMSLYQTKLSAKEIFAKLGDLEPSVLKDFTDQVRGGLTDVDLKNSKTLPTAKPKGKTR